jgi:1,4-dihydroxy-2-naphthoate octaprenyltransferase
LTAALSRRELWVGFLLYPGHTLPTAAAPAVVAAGLAVHDRVFAPVPLLVAFLGSWLIHLGGVFADQYELVRRHPELPEHPELLEALREGTLDLRRLRKAIVLCFAAAALTAPYLIHLGGWRYAPRGLADGVFFAMFGVVAVAGAYFIQAQAFAANAFVVGVPVGALVTNVLIIDDIRDRAFDAAKGWRTPAVRFGIGWSRTMGRARRAHRVAERPARGTRPDDTARLAARPCLRAAPRLRARGTLRKTGR